MAEKFYITTPIYYMNGAPHLGHAYATILADAFARYRRISGSKVFFLTGSDDHGMKNERKARAIGKPPKEFVDENALLFRDLYARLSISYDDFIQTSDQNKHWPGARALWKKLDEAEDIYKKAYRALYCVGCEGFKIEKDLIEGKCPDHDTTPEMVEEENYFFRASKYSGRIVSAIEKKKLRIVPESRRNEILSFLAEGLEDVSFSRPSAKVSWGIPVPGDSSQTMYVWCDALANYISALGYGIGDESRFREFWPADVHLLGKDILRFHAGIWPAMLLSSGLPLPRTLFVHGIILSGGKKMSKTIGNVTDPEAVIREYGADALRYYLLRHIPPFEDGDFTADAFKRAYNADLANGLGNLVSRIMKMAVTHLPQAVSIPPEKNFPKEYAEAFEEFDTRKAMDIVFAEAAALDQEIQRTEPFKLVKTDPEKGKERISSLVSRLSVIQRMLSPFMPHASEIISSLIQEHRMPEKPLFERKDEITSSGAYF